jgi:large subunit ribosomal protein L1
MQMAHKGKRYKKALELYDREKFYVPAEALDLAKTLASAKFDETLELTLRLGVDPRKADQQVRGSVSLPRGTGKSVRVAVFAQGEKAREAEEAGAEVVGAQDLADRIQKGWIDFDVAIASPDMMPVVGKLGKILGPRGLMPNPKSGTVTPDVARAVREVKAGKIEYRTDRQANVHTVIGKASFSTGDLAENYLAVVDEVLRAKPAAAKGKYLKSVTLAPSMGPGVRVDVARLKEATADGAGPAAVGAAS